MHSVEQENNISMRNDQRPPTRISGPYVLHTSSPCTKRVISTSLSEQVYQNPHQGSRALFLRPTRKPLSISAARRLEHLASSNDPSSSLLLNSSSSPKSICSTRYKIITRTMFGRDVSAYFEESGPHRAATHERYSSMDDSRCSA
jgi:hypothetical protein